MKTNRRVVIPLDVAIERLKQLEREGRRDFDVYIDYLTRNFRVCDEGFIPFDSPTRWQVLRERVSGALDKAKVAVGRLTPYALPLTLLLGAVGLAGAQDYQSVRDLRCIHYGANDYRNPCRVVSEEPAAPQIIVIVPSVPSHPKGRIEGPYDRLRDFHRRTVPQGAGGAGQGAGR